GADLGDDVVRQRRLDEELRAAEELGRFLYFRIGPTGETIDSDVTSLFVGAQLPHYFQTVELGQHHVEKNDAREQLPRQLDRRQTAPVESRAVDHRAGDKDEALAQQVACFKTFHAQWCMRRSNFFAPGCLRANLERLITSPPSGVMMTAG